MLLAVEAESGHGTHMDLPDIEFSQNLAVKGGQDLLVPLMTGDGDSRAGRQGQEREKTRGEQQIEALVAVVTWDHLPTHAGAPLVVASQLTGEMEMVPRHYPLLAFDFHCSQAHPHMPRVRIVMGMRTFMGTTDKTFRGGRCREGLTGCGRDKKKHHAGENRHQ